MGSLATPAAACCHTVFELHGKCSQRLAHWESSYLHDVDRQGLRQCPTGHVGKAYYWYFLPKPGGFEIFPDFSWKITFSL